MSLHLYLVCFLKEVNYVSEKKDLSHHKLYNTLDDS